MDSPRPAAPAATPIALPDFPPATVLAEFLTELETGDPARWRAFHLGVFEDTGDIVIFLANRDVGTTRPYMVATLGLVARETAKAP